MNQYNKMSIIACTLIQMTLILLFALPSIAHAYTDPGSGFLLWQLLGSFFIGLLFYLRRIISTIKRLLHKNDQR